VFAAEGPGVRVEATETSEGWRLSGTKPWCSAASVLDRALLTAHVGPERRLFAIDLHDPTVGTASDGWVSRGLSEVVSGPIQLADTPATPIGETSWYLTRSGFAWGGIGVAACWYGGTVALARTLWSAARRREPDQVALLLLGRVDRYVEAARHGLSAAAGSIDHCPPEAAQAVLLAERVRGTVAAAAEQVVTAVGHGLGPAPLAMDEEHARRVADLQIYLRQHHAERDTARLGGLLLESEDPPW
jgi:alkylation response protein AidB-like acyl-CoA dehydrogenase